MLKKLRLAEENSTSFKDLNTFNVCDKTEDCKEYRVRTSFYEGDMVSVKLTQVNLCQ